MRREAQAESAREKRDLVTGTVMEEARLIRFVPAPDGTVAPDLARKLPGRGMWVAADRVSVEAAAKRNLFARSAKARIAASDGLADQVAGLLRARLLAGLGLERRAGRLVCGFEKVSQALAAGNTGWLIEAADGAADGRRKLFGVARRLAIRPRVFGDFTGAELSLALGLENVIHTAFLAGRACDRWAIDAQRLSGFRPLFPESWREELPMADGTDIVPDAETI